MADLKDLRAGDIMIGPIHGFTGAGVGAAQLALAAAEPGLIWRQGPGEWFRKRHCGVVSRGALPQQNPFLVQAMPGGAEEIELTEERHWTPEYTYIRPQYQAPGVDHAVAIAARDFVGTPYDFATYAAIPLYRAGWRTKMMESIIAGTDNMMCSRLVDAALAAASYHLFDDGRLPGNVTPSELYRQLRRLPHQFIMAGFGKWVDGRMMPGGL